MQLGSGTFDLVPSLNYGSRRHNLRWGGLLRAVLRLGENDRGYSLGNRVSLTAFAQTQTLVWLAPTVRLNSQWWGKVDGRDEYFLGAQFLPAPVADPDKFGGTKVEATIGATLTYPGNLLERHSLEIRGGLPVYQNLTGPQPKAVRRFDSRWNWSF